MVGTGAVSFGPRTVCINLYSIGIEGAGLGCHVGCGWRNGVLARVAIWLSESTVSQCSGWPRGQCRGWQALGGRAVVQQLTPCRTDQV